MGLKFQRDDALDKRLEDFAFLPPEENKKEAVDISRFLLPEDDEASEKKEEPSK